ncbi:MAG: methylenetetrahydrofolate reductase [Tannerellaceae bacterium]|jgi:methylenetetrahydrofolate reductase (NADPH)|nr:methylenetetrahydrofolate reductase [Tannerellaceae bacterium]
MKVIEHISGSKQTAFSFEILPPLKGNSIRKVYSVVDKLREFDPKYINITSHHSEYIYKTMPDGSINRVNVRKRPGSVAIASAIQNKYGITAVPHIICKGFTMDETEYALIDLNFLGVHDLLLLRGDAKGVDPVQGCDDAQRHAHATDLQRQVNNFNIGIAVDNSTFEANETPFSYGMACYPEKHEEAPNMESDIYYAKQKVNNGAGYLVTQMFFDNEKYYSFLDRCRKEGITVPIIPGIKPIVFKDQLNVLPRVFRSEIPEALASELRKCATDEAAKEVGVEWCTAQCKDLIKNHVPSLHFYTFMATDSVCRVAKEVY